MKPEERLVALSREKGLKIALAESCTGGMIAKKITDIPGSSEIFELGVVAYANRIKTQILGVSEEILNTVGAVSPETAKEMASGVRKLAKADIGIGVTGIAGPGGGTEEKPVGLVYLSVATEKEVGVYRLMNSGTRNDVRKQTVDRALREALNAANEFQNEKEEK